MGYHILCKLVPVLNRLGKGNKCLTPATEACTVPSALLLLLNQISLNLPIPSTHSIPY